MYPVACQHSGARHDMILPPGVLEHGERCVG